MLNLEQSDNERAICTPFCRLVFRQNGERWSHVMEVGEPGHWHPAATAVEAPIATAPEQAAWPTYQELYMRERKDAIEGLFVGQHGPHHFSAAMHASQTVEFGTLDFLVRFEVAVRSRVPGSALEALYHVHARESAWEWGAETGSCWSFLDQTRLFVIERATSNGDEILINVDRTNENAFMTRIIRKSHHDSLSLRLNYSLIVTDCRESPTAAALATTLANLPNGGPG
jgi:hypothetical protein